MNNNTTSIQVVITRIAGGQAQAAGIVPIAGSSMEATEPEYPVTGVEGQNFQNASDGNAVCDFTDTNAVTTATDYKATIAWGTGSEAGTVNQASGGHFYVSPSTPLHFSTFGATFYTVTIQRGTHTTVYTGVATATDAPLGLVSLYTISGDAQDSYTFRNALLARFIDTDPGGVASDYAAVIDWGDSSGESSGTIAVDPNGGFDVYGTHTYHVPSELSEYGCADNWSFNVAVVDAGGASVDSRDIPMNGTAIVTGTGPMVGTGNGAIDTCEGGSGTGGTPGGPSNGGASNPSGSDNDTLWTQGLTATGTLGDRGPIAVADFGLDSGSADPSSFSAEITYANGDTVTGTIGVDPDNANNLQVTDPDYTFDTVGSQNATVAITYDYTDENDDWQTSTGSATALIQTNDGTFTDSGPLNGNTHEQISQSFTLAVAGFTFSDSEASTGDFTATIDWGDGTTSAGTIEAASTDPYTYEVVGTHTYTSSYVQSQADLTITIQHKPAGSSSTSAGYATVTVTNTLDIDQPTASPTPKLTWADGAPVEIITNYNNGGAAPTSVSGLSQLILGYIPNPNTGTPSPISSLPTGTPITVSYTQTDGTGDVAIFQQTSSGLVQILGIGAPGNRTSYTTTPSSSNILDTLFVRGTAGSAVAADVVLQLAIGSPGGGSTQPTSTPATAPATINNPYLGIINSNGDELKPGSGGSPPQGYVAVDNGDEGYNFAPNGAPVADMNFGGAIVSINNVQVPGLPPAPGDHQLVPIVIHAGAAGGTYNLTWSQNLALWENPNKTGPIGPLWTSTLQSNGTLTIYVEGLSEHGAGFSSTVQLHRIKNLDGTAAAPQPATSAAFDVYTVAGPQNVPGGSEYTYMADVPGGEWTASQGLVTDQDFGSCQILWGDGPTEGEAIFSPAPGFEERWQVNVVAVSVVPQSAFVNAAGTVVQLHPGNANWKLARILDLKPPANATHPIQAGMAIDITGPAANNGTRGVRYIQAGIVHLAKFSKDRADFDGTNPKQARVSKVENLQGGTWFYDSDAVKYAPWQDTAVPRLFVDAGTYNLQNRVPDQDIQNYKLQTRDIPGPFWISDQPLIGAVSVNRNELIMNHEWFLAASTTDGSAERNVLTPILQLDETVNASGTINNNNVWATSTNTPITKGIWTPVKILDQIPAAPPNTTLNSWLPLDDQPWTQQNQ